MSREAKLLILTWVVIGLVVAGVIGFYLGRTNAFKNLGAPQGVQQPGPQGGQLQGSPLPPGGQKPPQGGGQTPPAGELKPPQ